MSYVHETNLPSHVYDTLSNIQINSNALFKGYFIPLIFQIILLGHDRKTTACFVIRHESKFEKIRENFCSIFN